MNEAPYPSDLPQASRTDGAADPGVIANGSGVRAHPVTDRLAQGAHRTIDRLAGGAAPHIERIEGALAGAGGQLKEQARHAREKGDEWVEDLRTTVRRHPLSAVAAAMALGALIARITR